MKVLFIEGYLRERGNTAALSDAAISALRDAGHTVEPVGLRERTIADCQNCRKCAQTKQCGQSDDMDALYPRVLDADAIVLSSPVYMWHMTALAKAFIDRLYCVTDKLAGKKLGLVMTAGGDAFDGLSLAVASVKAFADYTGMLMGDTLFVAPAGKSSQWDKERVAADARAFAERLSSL